MRALAPVRWVCSRVDAFESRGRYVPGEDDQPVTPWRDFGWPIAAWLITVSMVIIFFAVAG
jgi:hypothetical protein